MTIRRPQVLMLAAAATFLLAAQSPPAQPAKPKTSAAKPGAPATKPAASAAKPPASLLAPVSLVPHGWPNSIYSFEGRLDTNIVDVTVDAPPAYQESFAFWTGRMKGSRRAELIQHLTTTRGGDENGAMSFRRQVSRYQIDLNEQGKVKAAGQPIVRAVTQLAWDGVLDREGNIREMQRANAPDNSADIEKLSFPLFDNLFPPVHATRTMLPGEKFTESTAMALPQRLSISGLESTGIVMTRVLTLRDASPALPQEATFDVEVTYAVNPETPPTAPRTSCAISGGGTGELSFDLVDGLYVRGKINTTLTIDIDAPLRALPDKPETADPGTAKSRIVMTLNMSGKRTITRMPGADQQEAPAADPAD